MINATIELEKIYLKNILNKLREVLKKSNTNLIEYSKNIKETKEFIWENIYDLDQEEIAFMNESVRDANIYADTIVSQNKKINKQLSTPYFGRIDFKTILDKKVINAYIGQYNFFDKEKNIEIIYDWRAPISSMFYDFELGEASYEAPIGKIHGNITTKRQYKIFNGKMEYMLENSLTIRDSVLIEELKNARNDKMKGIVSTIQREQNLIIRNDEAKEMIIQGVAGSGKSSIALHRVAFLLYKKRETLTSKNILIISPNKVFADYISNVLPELGEERILELSFEDIAKHELKNICKFQHFFEQIEYIIENIDQNLHNRIIFKSSNEIIHLLRKYVYKCNNISFNPKAIKFSSFSISAAYITQKFYSYSSRMSDNDKLSALQNDILLKIKSELNSKLLSSEINRVKYEIKQMFKRIDIFEYYKGFYKSIGRPDLFNPLSSNKIEYSDVFPLVYLKYLIEGLTEFPFVKHLIIDEMQDYTPVQYEVISKLFKCNKTILGDVSQTINPYSNSLKDNIASIFPNAHFINLFKSYRSTIEITNFAQKILYDVNLTPIERQGEKVDVIEYKNHKDQITGILNDITNSSYKSIGIICKTFKQAQEYHNTLNKINNNIYFLNPNSNSFYNGQLITSVQLAKGLEFEYVIIPDASILNYCNEFDRHLLYIACTRAMHKLKICYVNKKSIFI